MQNRLNNGTRKAVYARDGYRCALCDSTKNLQIHHYIHRGRGGSDHMHNLVTLCSYCHSHVHGHPLYETDFTAEDVEQMIVEYLADYYAPDWNPYRRE